MAGERKDDVHHQSSDFVACDDLEAVANNDRHDMNAATSEQAPVADLHDNGWKQQARSAQSATSKSAIGVTQGLSNGHIESTGQAPSSIDSSVKNDENEKTPGAFRMARDEHGIETSPDEETAVQETENENNASRDDSNEGSQPIFEAHLVDDEIVDTGLDGIDDQEGIMIETVVVDEGGAETAASPPRGGTLLVEGSPLQPNKDIIPMWRNRRLQIITTSLVFMTIAVTLGIVFGIQKDSGDDYGTGLGTTKETFARDVLPNYTQAPLDDPLSDQSLALDWLWKEPDATAALPLFRRIQRYALAVNFFAATELRTPEAYEPTGWLSDAHECTWTQNLAEDAVCRDERLVVIDQSDNPSIIGTIPPEIGLMTDLALYKLPHTALRGTIPTHIGLLSNSLDHVFLEDTRVSGPIPSEMGNLKKLLLLNLGSNSLTSTFPTELCNLCMMKELEVQMNSMNGTIPTEIGQLSQLILLSIHSNFFSGSLPSELGALTTLQGFGNLATFMTGTLPTELGNLHDMDEFYCNGTLTSGTIPTQMQLLTQLTALMLHDTQLNGTFPLCNLVAGGLLTEYSVPCERVQCSCNCSCQS